MTTVNHSFRVLLGQSVVWHALTDFNIWGGFVAPPGAQEKGGRYRWELLAAPGPGAPLKVYRADVLEQEWVIEEWAPFSRLRVASQAWHGKPWTEIGSRFDIALTATNPAETQVSVRFDVEFKHPVMRLILGLYPLGGQFKKVLDRFEQVLVAALPGG